MHVLNNNKIIQPFLHVMFVSFDISITAVSCICFFLDDIAIEPSTYLNSNCQASMTINVTYSA